MSVVPGAEDTSVGWDFDRLNGAECVLEPDQQLVGS